jgi:hypothetical protein
VSDLDPVLAPDARRTPSEPVLSGWMTVVERQEIMKNVNVRVSIPHL